MQAYWVKAIKRMFGPGFDFVVLHVTVRNGGRVTPAEVAPLDFGTQGEAWDWIEAEMPPGSYFTILPAYHCLNPTAKTRAVYVYRDEEKGKRCWCKGKENNDTIQNKSPDP